MYHFTIGFCIAVILSAVIDVANAAETRPYMYRVQQTAQLQALLNRGSVPVIYETVATTPAGQQVTRYTTRNTVLNATRLGSLARSAVGGPAVLAATAALLAYDYFYDEDTDSWTTQPVLLDDDVAPIGTAYCVYSSSSGYTSCSSTRYGVLQKQRELFGYPDNPQCVFVASTSGGQGGYGSITVRDTWEGGVCGGGEIGRAIYRPTAPAGFVPDGEYVQPGEPLTDSELGDAIKTAPPQAVSDILNDPISTGTWPDRWPEMVPTVQDIETQLGHDIEGAPAPTNPDQTITDGSTARPAPGGSGGSAPPELPAFCAWVPDWLCNLMGLPEHPDVPFVEIDEPDEFDSGVGSGQCPSDVIISTQYGSIPISWQYPCELATTFKPVVLFFAWIAALYIVVRVR